MLLDDGKRRVTKIIVVFIILIVGERIIRHMAFEMAKKENNWVKMFISRPIHTMFGCWRH